MSSLIDQIGILLDDKINKSHDIIINKLGSITSELEIVKNKNAFLENESKRKNFILYGVHEIKNESFNQLRLSVLYVLNNLMKSDITCFEIDQCCRLGKKMSTSRPILVKCITQWRKQDIMHRMNHLKGKGIYVEHDLTKEQIQRRRQAIIKMKELREQGQYAVVKMDKLVVSGEVKNDVTDAVELVESKPDVKKPTPDVKTNCQTKMNSSQSELSDEEEQPENKEDVDYKRTIKNGKHKNKKKQKHKRKTPK